MEMSPGELEATFDSVSLDINIGILNEARAGVKPMRLALALLVLPSGEERLASYSCEYGDGEGTRMEHEFIALALRCATLKPNERMILRVVEVQGLKTISQSQPSGERPQQPEQADPATSPTK